MWQNGIQKVKDIFKEDGTEYAFSTWFAEVPEEIDIGELLGKGYNEKGAMNEAILECLMKCIPDESMNQILESISYV